MSTTLRCSPSGFLPSWLWLISLISSLLRSRIPREQSLATPHQIASDVRCQVSVGFKAWPRPSHSSFIVDQCTRTHSPRPPPWPDHSFPLIVWSPKPPQTASGVRCQLGAQHGLHMSTAPQPAYHETRGENRCPRRLVLNAWAHPSQVVPHRHQSWLSQGGTQRLGVTCNPHHTAVAPSVLSFYECTLPFSSDVSLDILDCAVEPLPRPHTDARPCPQHVDADAGAGANPPAAAKVAAPTRPPRVWWSVCNNHLSPPTHTQRWEYISTAAEAAGHLVPGNSLACTTVLGNSQTRATGSWGAASVPHSS